MSDIHRLLDEAFVGVTMTPELQDLKEELRGSLTARTAELQSRGVDAATAAATAVAELDLPLLIAGFDEPSRPAAQNPGAAAAELARLHRVKPKPAFVVAATIQSAGLLAAAVATGLWALSPGPLSPGGVLFATIVGILLASLVDLSLRQETAQRYRMPNGRSVGYGLAAGALGAGLALGSLFVGHLAGPGLLVTAIGLSLAGVITFIALGVTQTNRMKPWALAQARQYESEDRFTQDPAAAARFGLYTVVIWTLAIAAFVVLSIAVGFVWSWLALVGGFVIFFLVLSRMLFAPQKEALGRQASEKN